MQFPEHYNGREISKLWVSPDAQTQLGLPSPLIQPGVAGITSIVVKFQNVVVLADGGERWLNPDALVGLVFANVQDIV